MEVTPPGAGEHSSDPSEQHSASTGDHVQVQDVAQLIGEPTSTATSTGTSTTIPDPEPEVLRVLRLELAHARLLAHRALDIAHGTRSMSEIDEVRAALSAPNAQAVADVYARAILSDENLAEYGATQMEAHERELLDALGLPRDYQPGDDIPPVPPRNAREVARLVYEHDNVVGLLGGHNMESYPSPAKTARLEAREYLTICKLFDALGVPRPRDPRR